MIDRNELDISYDGAKQHKNFGDRLSYLSLFNKGFISPRSVSNKFYKSIAWLQFRDEIIARDMGYDLGIPGVPIEGPILVHHILPVTEEDLETWNEDILLNPNNVICVSYDTHNKIHYGEPKEDYVERRPGDTKLW